MKQLLLTLAGTAIALSLSVQSFGQAQQLFKPAALKEAAPAKKILETGVPAGKGEVPLSNRGTEVDVSIGYTVYDLQSNYSACKRISKDDEGNIVGTWTLGLDNVNSYPDRGTGYNRYDAASGEWDDIPDLRLEQGVRTGWPNHVFTESGTEFIVTHVFTAGEYRLHTLRRLAGQANWTEADIPSDVPTGVLWPRAAVSGETVHVLAVSNPTGANGGVIYEGMDTHPLYYRSDDGGATWDVTDFIIPGLDTTYMKALGNADSYYIDARGDVVAVGIFSQWNDARIFISEDGGDTWSSTRIWDFPIDFYQIDQGYTTADLPPFNPDQPDSLAILTSDNCGYVLIDKNGDVHAFFGNMYVQDDNLTDTAWVYYPGTDGLSYWNESFGPDSVTLIAEALDLNGNDTLDIAGIANIATYFMSLTSMPTAGVDEENNIYLAYSMVMEGTQFYNDEDEQHYRHLMIIKSEDGGETWSEPYDAINPFTIGDTLFVKFIEAVFPSMLRDLTNGDIQLVYQQDFRPGLATRGDEDEVSENNIVFTQVGTVLSKVDNVVAPQTWQLRLAPNPAGEMTAVAFELKGSASVRLDLFNANGQLVRPISSGQLAPGQHTVSVDVSALRPGIYFVRLMVGPEMTVQRLVVE